MPKPIAMMSASVVAAAAAMLPGLSGWQTPPVSPPQGSGTLAPGPPVSGPGGMAAPAGGAGGTTIPSGSIPAASAHPVTPKSTSTIKSLFGDQLMFKWNSNAFSAHVWLYNSTKPGQNMNFDRFDLRDQNGKRVKTKPLDKSKTNIGAFEVRDFVVTGILDAPPAKRLETPVGITGLLWVSPDGPCTGTSSDSPDLPLEVMVEDRLPYRSCLSSFIFLGPWVVALLTGGVCAVLLRSKLWQPMGGATWSFAQSWGSNVTIGAGFLGALITTFTFPSHPFLMARENYNMLQGLFSAIIALAPLVFGLIRSHVKVQNGPGPEMEAQGFVAMFLVAGFLVLWGALGQVTTMAVLICEYLHGGTLPPLIALALGVLAGLLLLLLAIYGSRALYITVNELVPTGGVAPLARPFGALAGAPAAPGQRGEWPLL